jgi:hypothetical protein
VSFYQAVIIFPPPFLQVPFLFWFIFYISGDFDTQDSSIELDQYPITHIDYDSNRWTSEISIPSYLLPEPKCHDDLSVNWLCNVCAIYSENNGTVFNNAVEVPRIYLSHSVLPGKVANLHQLKSFVPIVLHETMEIRTEVRVALSCFCCFDFTQVDDYM